MARLLAEPFRRYRLLLSGIFPAGEYAAVRQQRHLRPEIGVENEPVEVRQVQIVGKRALQPIIAGVNGEKGCKALLEA